MIRDETRLPQMEGAAGPETCHLARMQHLGSERLTRRLIDALHVEAMLLADETRAYFDDTGRNERDGLPPVGRVAFACESLKITTRLMHIIAWLIAHRSDGALERMPKPLGTAPETDARSLAAMPATARLLIESSIDLYERLRRLDENLRQLEPPPSPALDLIDRLQRAF